MLTNETLSQEAHLKALPGIQPGEFVSALAIPPFLRQHILARAERDARQQLASNRAALASGSEAVLHLDRIDFLKGKSVMDNIAHPYELSGLHCQISNRLGLLQTKLLGLEHERDRRPETLHPAQRLRARLGRAFAHAPHLLVVDDPFEAMDPTLRPGLITTFLDFWERERPTVLFFTSQVNTALLLSDRILLPSGNSKLLAEFKPPLRTAPQSCDPGRERIHEHQGTPLGEPLPDQCGPRAGILHLTETP